MDAINEVKDLVGYLEETIAEGPYGEAYRGSFALSSVVAALRIVTLNMETQYVAAINAKLAGE